MSTDPLPPDLDELFGTMFGQWFGVAAAPAAGPDLTLGLAVSEEAAASGEKREVAYKYRQACVACGERGSTDPEAVRIACKTCAGTGQLRQAQGFFVVQRACTDCKGARERIANPCGACAGAGSALVDAKLVVVVPPGIAPGTVLRIAERGNADATGKRGDLLVRVSIGAFPGLEAMFRPQPELPRAVVHGPQADKARAAERKQWILTTAAFLAVLVMLYLIVKR